MKVGYKTTLGTTELENMGIIDRNTLSRNKVSDNYVGSPTQADCNSRNHNIHTYFLFSCFSCGKVEKTLVTLNA